MYDLNGVREAGHLNYRVHVDADDVLGERELGGLGAVGPDLVEHWMLSGPFCWVLASSESEWSLSTVLAISGNVCLLSHQLPNPPGRRQCDL